MKAALDHLKQFPELATLIEQHGEPSWEPTVDPFEALAGSLIYQQLSGKAAQTIYGRFASLFEGEKVTPENVLSVDHSTLRGVGLSTQKATYVQCLATAFLSDSGLRSLHELPDDEVRARLLPIKGVGNWTIDMFLLFDLQRPDVWPVGDLGVQKGVQKVLGLDALPKPDVMHQLAEPWRPHRSLAAWYMWRAVD